MIVDYKMQRKDDVSNIVNSPLHICLLIDLINHLKPIGKIECPICNIVAECYMQPICKHFLCGLCITKTYYIDDIEEIPKCLNNIIIKIISDKEMIDEIKQFNYDICIHTALIKEMRECPVCIR